MAALKCPVCKTSFSEDKPFSSVKHPETSWDKFAMLFERRGACPLCASHRDNGTGAYMACADKHCDFCGAKALGTVVKKG